MDRGHEVFVSHASGDHPAAEAVCGAIERRGPRCWIAPRDIPPGGNWGEAIVAGLDQCPLMVVLLTSRANASRHVLREVERADSKGAWIVPLRLEAVTLAPGLEYFLSGAQWFDALQPPLQAHLERLAGVVAEHLGAHRERRPPALEGAHPVLPREAAVQAFNELAPDDWGRTSPRKRGGFLRALFEDQ